MLTDLLVFAAFVIVLTIPQPHGLPWKTITAPHIVYGLLVLQVGLVGLVTWWFSRLVRRRLDFDPGWLPGAQRRFSDGTWAMRITIGLGFLASIYGTNWAARVRSWRLTQGLYAVDELIMLAPLFAGLLLGWTMLYSADKAIRRVQFERQLQAGVLHRRIWGLGTYLTHMFRQHVLIIAAPMIPIVIASDVTNRYKFYIDRWTRVPWGSDAAMATAAGLVFFFAPVMLRFIWRTRVLPPGELRSRLEAISRRIGLTYRRILIWESDGMVVNAAVVGLVGPVRYVMLSDGLIEMMDDRKIEAVFGHEAGHIKHRHMHFYVLFGTLTMFVVGGTMLLADLAQHQWPHWFPRYRLFEDYLQVVATAEIVLLWATCFGPISRRFEWQADLFGTRSVTPPPEKCDRPCILHGTAEVPNPGEATPVCASAAALFAEALHRIADLNGIPIEAHSWLHSSIANRKRLLYQYVYDPSAAGRLGRTVMAIKAVLLVGVAIGVAVTAWVYWPR